MPKKLLIVESPAKAKTINKYLGEDFVVKSSYGHIRDLDKGSKGIDKENRFEPNYVIQDNKLRVVNELKETLKQCNEVWLATDEDREGEAISWHLCEVLGLDPEVTKRIVFREITKDAIQKAVLSPRLVDQNMVDAQQARRILDRLVGFELSEILWRKVKGKLSAGRVQSVAVKLIVEREREIQVFETAGYYKVTALFQVKNDKGQMVELKADHNNRLDTKEEAEKLLESLKGSDYKISDINIKPAKRKPAPPFTTSTLQQEASRKLYFAVNRTMSAAQKLYEQGLITYMRTDSTSLSTTAIDSISSQIKKAYGENYSQFRTFKSKDANAQEAHEAIRPTNIEVENAPVDDDLAKLYSLIWKRTIASQMSDAKLEKTTVDITSDNKILFQAQGEVLKFDGFLKVYMESNDDDEEEQETKGILPPLTKGQLLDLDNVQATERFTRAPARYTEAALVKKLEELGIGRPSTYAPTITKIMEKGRGYVTKESREGVEREYTVLTLQQDNLKARIDTEITGSTSNRLYASDLGMLVVDFLNEHFDDVMDYSFTADVENKLDQIANGSEDWQDMISNFYGPFHDTVEKTIENAERAKGRRELGVDPKSGHTVLVQMTRYGPAVQIGTVEEVGEEGKPRFAGLRIGQSMETINFEDAMELFKLPMDLGEYEGEMISINTGRYGPYVKFQDKFISLPKGEDPMTFTLESAVELVKERLEADKPLGTYKGMDIQKGKGRFGPYLKWNEFFINVPKRYDSDNLTQDEMFELIAAKEEKEANKFIEQWPEDKIALENGRWGPFIRHKKKSYKLPRKADGERYDAEEAKAAFDIESIKKILLEEGAIGVKLASDKKATKAKAKPKAKAKAKPKAKAKK
jgi:DNA topoisomerase I